MFSEFVLLFQEEVAQRLIAKPGTKAYGLLSVLVQTFTLPELICMVPKTAFIPPPKVNSSLVRLVVKSSPLPDSAVLFFIKLVKCAFAHRRKTLYNNLKQFPEISIKKLEEAALQVGINLNRRAETLSVSEFLAISGDAGVAQLVER